MRESYLEVFFMRKGFCGKTAGRGSRGSSPVAGGFGGSAATRMGSSERKIVFGIIDSDIDLIKSGDPLATEAAFRLERLARHPYTKKDFFAHEKVQPLLNLFSTN
jgi:hypothetical protein